MSIIFMLVIIGVLVAGGFLLAFVWSVKSGQYDDTYSPAVRILFDDAKPVENFSGSNEKHSNDEPEQEKNIDNKKK